MIYIMISETNSTKKLLKTSSNQKIIYIYQNQMELSDQIEEEEEELNENKETIEKVNIINKLVC